MKRRQFLWSSAAFALPVVTGAPSWSQAAASRVTTRQGVVEGVQEGGLSIWRGIPYAAPPVGPLRWQPPEPAPAWDGVRPARAFGPVCIQKVARNEPEHSLKDVPQSEDCLTLNIWAPRDAAPASLPVMVWIHGGSFRFGAGSLELYHGDGLTPRGVVVVTLNYRLGLFGSFAHPAVEGGNFGLMDQIAALRWVRDNIAGFGGDPDNVTLFGESAGGVSVGYLMSAPSAQGLFHKAIIQSGGLAVPTPTPSEAAAVGTRVASDLGLTDADGAALRALPADALRDVDYGPADVMPMRDGVTVPKPLADAFAEGDAGDIPLLIGWNTAEAGFFGPRYWENIRAELGEDRWQALQPLLTWGAASADAAAEQIASEWFAGSVSRRMALTHRGPVHAYRFGWVPPEDRDTTRGAIHTAEIPYVFDNLDSAGTQGRALSEALADRWVAFARTGDPDWPTLGADGTPFLLIGEDLTLGPDPVAALDTALAGMDLPPRP